MYVQVVICDSKLIWTVNYYLRISQNWGRLKQPSIPKLNNFSRTVVIQLIIASSVEFDDPDFLTKTKPIKMKKKLNKTIMRMRTTRVAHPTMQDNAQPYISLHELYGKKLFMGRTN